MRIFTIAVTTKGIMLAPLNAAVSAMGRYGCTDAYVRYRIDAADGPAIGCRACANNITGCTTV